MRDVDIVWKDSDIDHLPSSLPCYITLHGKSWFVGVADSTDPKLAGRVLVVFRVRNFAVIKKPAKVILGDVSAAIKTCLGDVLSALRHNA